MQTQGNRNITRYTYARTAFQGWRVCLSRRGKQFVRYFSDKFFGCEEKSFAAARDLRDRLLADLQAHPDDIEAVYAKYSTRTAPSAPH